MKKFLSIVAILSLVFSPVTPALAVDAVDYVWSGGGGDTSVFTEANWEGGVFPQEPTDNIFFGTGGGIATDDSENFEMASITFNRAADFSIIPGGEGRLLKINAGGITAASPTEDDRTYTISQDVTLGASQTWTVSNNGLNTTTLLVSGDIGESAPGYGLTKTDDGILTLSGANTYTGTTTINAGTLLLTENQASPLDNFTGDGVLKLGDAVDLTANITTATGGQGTLTFEGDGEVTGSIGAEGAYLQAINVAQGYSYEVELDNNVYVNRVNFGAMPEGWTEKDGHDTNVYFDGDTTIGAGGITTGWNEYGVVEFYGDATINGDIGASEKALWQVWLDGEGTKLTLNGNVYQNEVPEPDPSAWARTTIYFNNDDQTIEVADGKTIGADIAKYVDEGSPANSTLTFLGSATVTGDIGYDSWVSEEDGEGSIAPLDVVNLTGDSGTTVTLKNVYAYDMTVGAGALQLNGSFFSPEEAGTTLKFTADGKVTLGDSGADDAYTIEHNITTDHNGQGTLSFDANGSVTGQVGAQGAYLNAINVTNENSNEVYFGTSDNNAVYVNNLNFGTHPTEEEDDDTTVTFYGDAHIGQGNDGDGITTGSDEYGIVNFQGNATVNGNVGYDDGDENYAWLYQVNANGGEDTLVDLKGDVFSDELNFGGDGEIRIGGTVNVYYVGNVSEENGTGTLTLKGGGEIYEGIGNSESVLSAVNINGNSGTEVIVYGNLLADTVNVQAGTLTLDYTHSESAKMGNLPVLTLGGGTLNFIKVDSTPCLDRCIEEVGSTILNAGGSSIVSSDSSYAVLRMNLIERNVGATIDFGADNIASTKTGNVFGILGAWATVGGSDWATKSATAVEGDGNNFIVAYDGYSEDDIINAYGGEILDEATNVRIGFVLDKPAPIILSDNITTINTLLQSTEVTATVATVAVVDEETVNQTLRTNGIMIGAAGNGDPAKGALIIGENVGDGFLTAASKSGELVLINNSSNDLTINSVIADNTDLEMTTPTILTKSGDGTLVLNGVNTYTGATMISGGTVQIAKDSALGDAGDLIFSGGTLNTTATFELNSDRGIELAGSGTFDVNGIVDEVEGSAETTLTYKGVIAGEGDLIKTGTGVLTLDGVNTYTGATIVEDGTLNLNQSLTESSGLELRCLTTVNLADGKAITVPVTATDNDETLNFLGDGTVTANIGTDLDPLSEINLTGGAGKTVTLNGDVYVDDVNVDVGTLEMNGNLTCQTKETLNFVGDGFVMLTDDHDINANVKTYTDNTGTLTLEGDNIVDGDIGGEVDVYNEETKEWDGEYNYLKDVTLTGGSGTTVTLNNVYAYDMTVGDGTLQLNGTFFHPGDAPSGTLKFVGDGTVILASDRSIRHNITTAQDGEGNLSFEGNGTVTGQIGSSIAYLNAINVSNNGDQIDLGTGSGAEPVPANTYINSLNFRAEESVEDETEVTFYGDAFIGQGGASDGITTGLNGHGIVNFKSNATINGDIGQHNKGDGNFALNEINLEGAAGTTVTVNGDLYAYDVNVGAGTLEMNGDLTSPSLITVNFTDDGFVILTSGHDINTNVKTDNDEKGTLTLEGDNVVNGDIGGWNSGDHYYALKLVNLTGRAGTTVTLNGDVYAADMNVGAGALELNGSFYNPNEEPKTLNFTGDGEVILADEESIEHNVTTETNGTGTLTFKGYGEVIGTVGIETPEEGAPVIKYLNAIKVNSDEGSKGIVTFADVVYVNGLAFEGSGAARAVTFRGDAFIGTDGITTDVAGHERRVIFGGEATVAGQVGSSEAYLSRITLSQQATFNSGVYVDYLKLSLDSEDTSVTFNGATFIGEGGITTTADGDGIVNFNSAATVDGDIGSGNYLNEVNIGSGTVTVYGDVDAQDVNVGTGTLYMKEGDLTAELETTLTFTGDGVVKMADGYDIHANIETDNPGTGTLTFEGNGEVTGKIGALHQSLGTINVAQRHEKDIEDGFYIDLDRDVYVNNLNFGPDPDPTLAGDLAYDTEVTFHGDAYIGSGGITTEWPGYGIVSFDANAVVDGKVGTSTASCLWEINVANNGSSVDFNSAVYTSSLNFVNEGSGSTEVTFNDNASIVFDQGSFDLGPEESTPVITTEDDGYGIVNFNGNATVTGYLDEEAEDYLDAIGESGNALDEVNIDGTAGTIVTVNGDLWANDVNIGSGTLYMNGNLRSPSENTVRFTGDGYLRVTAGHDIHSNIFTQADGTGTLTFGGGDNTVFGNIGSSIAAVKAVNLTGDSDVTVTGDLYAYNVMLGTNVLNMDGGDFTQKAGGTISLTLASGTADDNGHIYMGGGRTATVEAGGKVSVTVPTGISIANGTQFTVIDGSGDIALPTVTSNTRRYAFTASVDTGDLILTSSEGSYVAPTGATGNESVVGNTLNGISNPSGDMNTVLDQLGTLSDSEYNQALDTMHPDVSSGVADGSRSLTSQGFTTVSNRLGGARNGGASVSGISSGDRLDGVGVWMQALGSNIKQGERKGVEGYNGNLFGTTIGADKVIDNHFRAGFAGSYGWARVKSKTSGSPSDDINSFQGTIYGSFDSLDLNKARQGGKKSYEAVRSQVEKSWYVDGMFAFTQNNYDSRREIWVTPASERIAKAEHYGQQYSTNFEAGYKFVFEKTKNLEVTPFVGLGYNYLYLNKYKENGASSLNLTVDGQGFNQLEQSLGTKLAYPLVNKKMGTFIPSAKAAWLYDYIADTFETTASFAGGGASFNTQGAKPARNGMLFGAELAFLNKGNVTLTGNWDIELKDQYMSNTYYGTARYDF